MNIAFIVGSYKKVSEQWIWRQVNYLKGDIAYIGLIWSKSVINSKDLPIINIFENLYDVKNYQSVLTANAKSFFLARKLNQLENDYYIDIYYIHYLTNAYTLLEYFKFCKKKIFIHCHGFDITKNLKHPTTPNKNKHQDNYISFLNNIPKNFYFIANSLNTKNKLLEFTIPENRIFISNFGVPIKEPHYKKKEQIKILYLGRLVDFKGPDLTIRAFEKACEKGLNAELILAGDGYLMVTCQLLKKRSPYRNRIKLLGAVNYETGIRLREECDIFTAHNITGELSNQEEAYGVSILEAMGTGLPVVTGRSGGIKETVIHGLTGFLFEPGNIEEHANHLFNLGCDFNLRAKIGFAAYCHVKKNFSLEEEKYNILKIIQS